MITFARRLATPTHELHPDDLWDLAATWGVSIEMPVGPGWAYATAGGQKFKAWVAA